MLQLGDPPQQLLNYSADLYLEDGFGIEPPKPDQNKRMPQVSQRV
jgi:hypothetical protein